MQKLIITLLGMIGLVISSTAAHAASGVRYQDGIVVEKLKPRVREISSGHGIDAINLNYYRLFMYHPQIIARETTQNAPRLIRGTDERMLMSRGERVYAYGVSEPGRYLVYRPINDILDPDTKQFLGQQVLFSGIVSTLPYTNSALEQRDEADATHLKPEEYYTRIHPLVKVPTETARPMLIDEAASEIRHGDYLMKIPDGWPNVNWKPHELENQVTGKVAGVIDGIRHAGQFQTIVLNLGKADGVTEGSILGVYKQSRQTKIKLDDVAGKSKSIVKYVSIPAEEVGKVMVYQAGDHAASAIILESNKNLVTGDIVSNLGHDLDNMLQDSKHRKNRPQTGHSGDFHQYDAHTPIQ